LRNLSIALGNAPYSQRIVTALNMRLGLSDLLDEHIHWALVEQQRKSSEPASACSNNKQQRLIRIVEKGLSRDA
ncbi:MAG: tRNA epoxyqueuosine(34) reductase QueG, partial [Vibrio ordalii]